MIAEIVRPEVRVQHQREAARVGTNREVVVCEAVEAFGDGSCSALAKIIGLTSVVAWRIKNSLGRGTPGDFRPVVTRLPGSNLAHCPIIY
jgi:hypothetical protein